MKKFFALIALLLALAAPIPSYAADEAPAQPAGEEKLLRWGGDSEGGFPYMFPSPSDPDKLIGFEVDIVEALAKEMGRKPVYVNNAWDNLIPGLERDLYDIAINGLEVTPEHEAEVNFSIPYYKTYLQLAVRKDDSSIEGLQDLKGKIAGTLKESYAQMVLEEVGDVEIRTYIVEANTYEDLANGRLEAALFDQPIALYSAGFNPEIKFVGPPIGEIIYAIAMRKGDKELLREVNQAIVALRDSGKLREIYDKWNLWTPVMATTFNDYDPPKYEPVYYNEWAEAHRPELTLQKRLERYWDAMPLFAHGALVTMEVSIVAMVIAISLGLALAVTRVFAPKWLAMLAAGYVEIVRGTPVLIQLFFIFYGLPSIGIKFSPFWAGAIGLGLNYAAYEAEIYRTGLFAIPRTQWESALALGMTRWQAMREVILPQAVRVVIPPITNDFISLLKDSSLVSIITMVDLTKVYGQVSATYYDYFGPGILVAVIYLVLGLPFVRFARYTEKRLSAMEKEGRQGHSENIYRNSTRYI
ncbi:MAG: ABC transporter substrate-binding protein/permease [Synergistaceae bacterium]|nr:ABC transporter substrate-binding protein/permease [Synergistaceae bacterium]